MGEKLIADFVREIRDYSPRIKANSRLRDDYKLMAVYYTSKKAGKSIMLGGVTLSLNEIRDTAKKIYKEIEGRRAENTMEYEWDLENMKPAALELFESFKNEFSLSAHITEDITLMKSVVYLPNSSSSEIRLNLEDGEFARIIKAKLYKMFPDDVAQKLNIVLSNMTSENSTPLFDLVLKRREGAPDGPKIVGALTLASANKVFYNIPDLMEACFI